LHSSNRGGRHDSLRAGRPRPNNVVLDVVLTASPHHRCQLFQQRFSSPKLPQLVTPAWHWLGHTHSSAMQLSAQSTQPLLPPSSMGVVHTVHALPETATPDVCQHRGTEGCISHLQHDKRQRRHQPVTSLAILSSATRSNHFFTVPSCPSPSCLLIRRRFNSCPAIHQPVSN